MEKVLSGQSEWRTVAAGKYNLQAHEQSQARPTHFCPPIDRRVVSTLLRPSGDTSLRLAASRPHTSALAAVIDWKSGSLVVHQYTTV